MPYSPPNPLIDRVEGVVLMTLVCGYGLALLVRFLQRSRPDFRPARPLVASVALRLLALAGVSASGLAATLQGGDELGFLGDARTLAATPFSSGGWLPGGPYPLHEIVFAVQIKLGHLDVEALRVTQVSIAVCGLLLLSTAVHDLAGRRPGQLTFWLTGLEPGSIFFSELLHKEPLMILASGLVALGGARAWGRVDLVALVTLVAGSGVAIFTRPYAGWFLAAGAVLIVLHATVRDATKSLGALAILACVLVGIAATVPVILQVSSKQSLQANLQNSQNANAIGTTAGRSGPNGNNLALEQVDYSTRGAIITNLPIRIRDLLLRPYPWQVANTSEQL
ncbi:MAG TPA: hypothetical protein VFR48_04135, partial [Solirubrobacteraceae bacterium]|nr:hypothetical protein [Solirubrobacteraceae bacterium]